MDHLITAAIVLAFAVLTPAHAQTDSAATYPSRAVTIVVPFPPGGGNDVGSRLVAQKLSVKWGQPVVTDNKAVNSPDVRQRLQEAGIEVGGGAPEQFTGLIQSEMIKWATCATSRRAKT